MASRLASFKAALTDVDTTAQVPLGYIREDGIATHKYVKFSGTTAIAVGDVLCYVASDTTDQTVDGANTALGAGVALAVVASGSVQYGFIQIRGPATLNAALAGSPAVGDNMTTAAAAAGAVTKNAAANTQTVGNVIHVANKIIHCAFPE